MSNLCLNFLELELNVNDIIGGIRRMIQGKIDDHIVSSKFLLNVLKDIKEAGHTLILPNNNYYLKYYEKLINVGTTYDSQVDSITFYLSIPTYAAMPMPTFKLSKILTFPTPIHKTSNAIIIYENLPKFIATSSNYFIEIDNLNSCVEFKNNYFCELTEPINNFKVNQNCSAALFKNIEDKYKHCKVNIANGAET